MSRKHLSIIECAKIETLRKEGYSFREIGLELCRHHSSIARELKRVKCGISYRAECAQLDYKTKRLRSKPHGKRSESNVKLIVEKLQLTWSPEQISNTVMLGKVCHKTIYNWIKADKIPGASYENLRRKGLKRKCRNLAHYSRGTPIRKCPKEVFLRATVGHWELDTVVSGREIGACLAAFIERKTRFFRVVKMPDRTAPSMKAAIQTVRNSLPKQAFLTATTDRGGEFACYDEVQNEMGIDVYFADPYCPHQRGSNEYANGLLREFYPKKMKLENVEQSEIDKYVDLINNRPRKCLNWISLKDMFLQELSRLTLQS